MVSHQKVRRIARCQNGCCRNGDLGRSVIAAWADGFCPAGCRGGVLAGAVHLQGAVHCAPAGTCCWNPEILSGHWNLVRTGIPSSNRLAQRGRVVQGERVIGCEASVGIGRAISSRPFSARDEFPDQDWYAE